MCIFIQLLTNLIPLFFILHTPKCMCFVKVFKIYTYMLWLNPHSKTKRNSHKLEFAAHFNGLQVCLTNPFDFYLCGHINIFFMLQTFLTFSVFLRH